jgi:hypothetical protein
MNWIKFDKDDESTWPKPGIKFKGRFIVGYYEYVDDFKINYGIIEDIRDVGINHLKDMTHWEPLLKNKELRKVEIDGKQWFDELLKDRMKFPEPPKESE